MILSLKFSWYFTERKYYDLLSENNEKNDVKSSPNSNSRNINKVNSKKNNPSFHEIESVFIKFYKNSLDENITSSQLRPKSPAKEKILFNFYFLMRLLKEIARECPEGNPRPRIWLHILQDL